MFGLGFTEILVVLTVALLVFGPKRLPEIARTLGKTMGELRRTLDDVKFEMSQAELEGRKGEESKLPNDRASSPKDAKEPVPEKSESTPADAANLTDEQD